ncbi:hypothetical protein MARINOS108_120522 [Marinoscillum sp. 108]|nr:hypothetical protein MARINOS108_120522 [Marinoscillum sp. 108]
MLKTYTEVSANVWCTIRRERIKDHHFIRYFLHTPNATLDVLRFVVGNDDGGELHFIPFRNPEDTSGCKYRERKLMSTEVTPFCWVNKFILI